MLKHLLSIGAMASLLASCNAHTTGGHYGPRSDDGRKLPAVGLHKIPEHMRRAEVTYVTSERPGTIIIDTGSRHLYLVRGDNRALRFGVGIGREGFGWKGRAVIHAKKAWPTWTPPAEMIRRQPGLAPLSAGVPPSVSNPMGARALYLLNEGRDIGYRIHGTPEWWSIGYASSSGCIRMINQDVMDLYEQVPTGTVVVVN